MGACLGVQNAQFVIYVKTGDKKNAGTDANVKIKLHGPNGSNTDGLTLDNFFRNDFESGQLDVFPIKEIKVKDFGSVVSKVEFWRDNAGIGADWFVDKIVVENNKTNESFTFPVFRWIKPDYHYIIEHLDTSLPQFDPHKDQRLEELEDKRLVYQNTQKVPGGPAQVNDSVYSIFVFNAVKLRTMYYLKDCTIFEENRSKEFMDEA